VFGGADVVDGFGNLEGRKKIEVALERRVNGCTGLAHDWSSTSDQWYLTASRKTILRAASAQALVSTAYGLRERVIVCPDFTTA